MINRNIKSLSIIASPRDEKSLSVITFSVKYPSPTTRR